TKLKGGKGMWSMKEGDEIHANELHLLDQKGAQQVTGIGPGQIDLLDKKTGKRTRHARWSELLVSGKEDGYDLLTLTGNATFIEDEPAQHLQGDEIKVWFESQDKTKPQPQK